MSRTPPGRKDETPPRSRIRHRTGRGVEESPQRTDTELRHEKDPSALRDALGIASPVVYEEGLRKASFDRPGGGERVFRSRGENRREFGGVRFGVSIALRYRWRWRRRHRRRRGRFVERRNERDRRGRIVEDGHAGSPPSILHAHVPRPNIRLLRPFRLLSLRGAKSTPSSHLRLQLRQTPRLGEVQEQKPSILRNDQSPLRRVRIRYHGGFGVERIISGWKFFGSL
mmetsp:Transcript_966/g.1928  ORF Transcript_966/g.1928 Transcript_966/m.1928 type:complete len:227 (+) Transcript_966:559-1239(+)